MSDFTLRAALIRRLVKLEGLLEFAKQVWQFTSAGEEFAVNWHHENVCKALERVALEYVCTACESPVDLRELIPQSIVEPIRWTCPACGASLRRVHSQLVINQPPATTKTKLVSVIWPAWIWTIDPRHRFMFVSYEDKVVQDAASEMLAILKSDLYQAAWPHVELVGGTTAKQAVGFFRTTANGCRYSLSMQGGITGKHADTLVVDDPIKPNVAEATSGIGLAHVESIYGNTLRTRRRDPQRFAEVCIMQRVADGDLSSLLLNMGAEHLMYPMRFEPDASWDHGNTMGLTDPRTSRGELLWPNRYTERVIEQDTAGMPPVTIAAQYQQNPTPESGSFFEDAWFREYDELPRPWSLTFFQVWDLGFKGRDRGTRREVEARSRVHGALWAWDPDAKRVLLVDERIGRWNYPDTKRTFLEAQICELWNRAVAVIVEDKANGAALISELQEIVPSIYPWEPQGSKEDRARRHSARVEARVLWLPKTDWARDFRAELVRFPRQKLNDRVDTTTMLLDYLYAPGGIARAALQGLVEFFERP